MAKLLFRKPSSSLRRFISHTLLASALVYSPISAHIPVRSDLSGLNRPVAEHVANQPSAKLSAAQVSSKASASKRVVSPVPKAHAKHTFFDTMSFLGSHLIKRASLLAHDPVGSALVVGIGTLPGSDDAAAVKIAESVLGRKINYPLPSDPRYEDLLRSHAYHFLRAAESSNRVLRSNPDLTSRVATDSLLATARNTGSVRKGVANFKRVWGHVMQTRPTTFNQHLIRGAIAAGKGISSVRVVPGNLRGVIASKRRAAMDAFRSRRS